MGDTISREQAIDAVNCITVMKGIRSGKSITAEAVDCAKRTIADNIRQLPTILPKRGKWERHYSRPNVLADLFWHCSECGYKDSENYAPVYHHFCTNCGADMRTAEQIVHDAIDNTPMAEDAYPGIKERLHKAVDDMREVTNGN